MWDEIMKFKGSIFWADGKKEKKAFPLNIILEGHYLNSTYLIEEVQEEGHPVKIATIIAVIFKEGVYAFDPRFFKKGVTFFARVEGGGSCVIHVEKIINH